MKRTLSLAGVTTATVVLGIQLILNLIDLFAFFAVLGGMSGAGSGAETAAVILAILLYIFLLAFIVVAFILTLMMFKYVNASPEIYAKKKAVTIASIVFDFLVIILLLISFFGSANVGTLIFSIICFIALLAATILLIIDLVNEKKRVEGLTVRPVEESSSNAVSTNNTQEQANQEETKTETEVKEESEENNEEK